VTQRPSEEYVGWTTIDVVIEHKHERLVTDYHPKHARALFYTLTPLIVWNQVSGTSCC
jgi:hypothetical protein